MNRIQKQRPFIAELIKDYKKAREKRDFMTMRETYIELWKYDSENPYPDNSREEIVLFTEISDDNSVKLPYELSDFFNRICCISLFDGYINISALCNGFEPDENYLKKSSLEFRKTMLKNKFTLSQSALTSLNAKRGDLLRIEVFTDEMSEEFDIYNENNDWRLKLKD